LYQASKVALPLFSSPEVVFANCNRTRFLTCVLSRLTETKMNDPWDDDEWSTPSTAVKSNSGDAGKGRGCFNCGEVSLSPFGFLL